MLHNTSNLVCCRTRISIVIITRSFVSCIHANVFSFMLRNPILEKSEICVVFVTNLSTGYNTTRRRIMSTGSICLLHACNFVFNTSITRIWTTRNRYVSKFPSYERRPITWWDIQISRVSVTLKSSILMPRNASRRECVSDRQTPSIMPSSYSLDSCS
jgi:hypothetical protein